MARYGERWREMWKDVERWGDVGRCGEIWGGGASSWPADAREVRIMVRVRVRVRVRLLLGLRADARERDEAGDLAHAG